MNKLYEYMENSEWVSCTKEELVNKPNYPSLINRYIRSSEGRFNYYFIREHSQSWYLGKKLHRLDGPATIIKKEIDGAKYYICNWWIHGKKLTDLNLYLNRLDVYIEEYPKRFNEILLLCRHNKWISEERLMLIPTIKLFTGMSRKEVFKRIYLY